MRDSLETGSVNGRLLHRRTRSAPLCMPHRKDVRGSSPTREIPGVDASPEALLMAIPAPSAPAALAANALVARFLRAFLPRIAVAFFAAIRLASSAARTASLTMA